MRFRIGCGTQSMLTALGIGEYFGGLLGVPLGGLFGVEVSAVAIGYFLGSIPFGLLAGKLLGKDVRTEGSGNIGATNVARTVGKRIGVAVLLLDALKGAIAVSLAIGLAAGIGQAGLFSVAPELVAQAGIGSFLPAPHLAGVAAVVGHCFPVWLKGRGGKGVATSLGVFAMLSPYVAIAAAIGWAAAYAKFRVASIGSLLCAIGVPLAMALTGASRHTVIASLCIGAIVVIRHISNLKRIIQKSELGV